MQVTFEWDELELDSVLFWPDEVVLVLDCVEDELDCVEDELD